MPKKKHKSPYAKMLHNFPIKGLSSKDAPPMPKEGMKKTPSIFARK